MCSLKLAFKEPYAGLLPYLPTRFTRAICTFKETINSAFAPIDARSPEEEVSEFQLCRFPELFGTF